LAPGSEEKEFLDGRYDIKFLFILLENLVFDFPLFDVPQVLTDEVLGVRRILLDAAPFFGKRFVICAEMNQDSRQATLLTGPAQQFPKPGIGEEIKSS
jgi:hypothetical protein